MIKRSIQYWIIPVLFLAFGYEAPIVHADTLNADGSTTVIVGGYVAAIDNITLNGELYNVTFPSTGVIPNGAFLSLDFQDLTNDVVVPIDTDLGMNMFGAIGSGMNNFYVALQGNQGLVPSLLESGGEDYFWIASVVEAPWPCSSGAVPCAIPSGEIFADFTPVVVATPEPATAPLTLAGLGVLAVLMWKRRQEANRHPQAA